MHALCNGTNHALLHTENTFSVHIENTLSAHIENTIQHKKNVDHIFFDSKTHATKF